MHAHLEGTNLEINLSDTLSKPCLNAQSTITAFIPPTHTVLHTVMPAYLKDGFRGAVVCPVSSVDVSGHLGQFVAPWRRLSLSAAALILRREMHAGLQLHLRLHGS